MLASSSVDGRTILWNLSTGDKIGVLNQENGEAIRGCAFRFVGSSSTSVIGRLIIANCVPLMINYTSTSQITAPMGNS